MNARGGLVAANLNDDIHDPFGLAATMPRPAWVVLDAAREQRFTGELVLDTTPETRVYLDRGEIYLAERTTDPPIGARLVDAGALSAVQLEHGTVRLGDQIHLGRLFERVPAVDRHTVIVTAELMTEECLAWLAPRRISAFSATPYVQHHSGVQRWDRTDRAGDVAAGEPLPLPAPFVGQRPLAIAMPEPALTSGPIDGDVIRWDEQLWLDEPELDLMGPAVGVEATPRDLPAPPPAPAAPAVEPAVESAVDAAVESPVDAAVDAPVDLGPADDAPGAPGVTSASVWPPRISTDWIDRLDTDGLPMAGSKALGEPARLAPVPVAAADKFEVIWPTGEVDEQFGDPDRDLATFPDAERDRAPMSARVGSSPAPSVSPDDDPLPVRSSAAPGAAEATGADEVVLAVRRAIATIETGSLTTRRRGASLESTGRSETEAETAEPVLPGRLAVRQPVEPAPAAARSVFDDLPLPSGLPLPVPGLAVAEHANGAAPESNGRTGALRRLITNLRRQ